MVDVCGEAEGGEGGRRVEDVAVGRKEESEELVVRVRGEHDELQVERLASGPWEHQEHVEQGRQRAWEAYYGRGEEDEGGFRGDGMCARGAGGGGVEGEARAVGGADELRLAVVPAELP